MNIYDWGQKKGNISEKMIFLGIFNAKKVKQIAKKVRLQIGQYAGRTVWAHR